MKITILTLFPEMFEGPFSESILKRAQEKELLKINFVNIRDFGEGRHKVVDDRAYGGGVGMVLKVDILDKAIQAVKDPGLSINEEKIILLDPRGETFKQNKAKEFSKIKHLILICAHYEGVDERVRSLIDETISIGDFILTGGEIPAMLIVDSVARLVTGVLKEDATEKESFRQDQEGNFLLEYPQYTTPREYKGMNVPEVLLSGNHKEIEKWKVENSQKITKKFRPDLLSTD
ncbi:MAG TPA: tRNA (guanosine(37)-N1)-methyltransferase TrmD [Patescibacteria group bacterium]